MPRPRAQALPTEPSDAILVARARSDDAATRSAAWEALAARHTGRLFALGMAMLRDAEAAEELVQEVFLTASLHLNDLREPAALGGWLGRMARHRALTWLRQGARRSRLARMVTLEDADMPEPPDPAPLATDLLAERDDLRRLAEALERLPAADRALVVRHVAEGESQRTLAAEWGVNQSSVSRRLEKALETVRHLMGAKPGDAAPDGTEGLRRRAASARGRAAALAILAAGLAAERRAALAAACEIPAATLSQRTSGEALVWWTTWWTQGQTLIATGVTLMSASQKTIALLAAASLLAGGVYLANRPTAATAGAAPTQSSIAAPAQAGAATQRLAISPDAEHVVRIPTGTTIDLELPPDSIFEVARARLTATADGKLKAEVTGPDGNTITHDIAVGAEESPGTTVQIWKERNLLRVQSFDVRAYEGGVELAMFSINRPDLLTQAGAHEADYRQGRIARTELTRRLEELFAREGLLPNDPRNRTRVLTLLRGLYQ